MDRDLKIYIAGHSGMVGSAIERKLRNEGFNNIISMSMSWGGGEGDQMSNVLNPVLTANENIIYCASSGDYGSKPNQSMPASLPNVVGCGGTSLVFNNGLGVETGWNRHFN